MARVTKPWNDADAEYRVLVDFVLPEAQAQYGHAVNRWAGVDAKAFGFLAIVAATIGGLAATHQALHRAWWAAATGCAVAGACFIVSLLPRDLYLGPDLIDLHDETRAGTALDAARAMLDQLTLATERVEEGFSDKARYYSIGLAILAVSLLGCLPVVLFRP